jgi:exonuclease III
MLEQTEPDIIIASETWLHQGILEREVLPEHYCYVARRDKLKSAHGGVAVIAKSDIEGVEVDTPRDTEFVMMVLLIGIVYLFPFIDVVSHSMSGRLASPPIQMVESRKRVDSLEIVLQRSSAYFW